MNGCNSLDFICITNTINNANANALTETGDISIFLAIHSE